MELTITDRAAIVSGVKFEWALRCPFCREITRVTSDGKVRAGLLVSASGKTCRWYQPDVPGRMPVPPAHCPSCWRADAYRGYPAREAYAVRVGCEALSLLDQAYRHFRATFAGEAARADELMRRALQRA